MADHNTDHWALIARAGDGKSTFASQMSPEYLVADLDGRWDEQTENTLGVAHVVRESETLKLITAMEALSKSAPGIRTVIFDSGTAILDYIQSKGRLQADAAKAAGQKFNLNDVHKTKADTMRVLRLAALKFHANVLWIFHLEDGKMDGKDHVRTTIPVTEMERLKSNLNAIMTIVKDKSGMRGVRIEWCRYNNNVASGQIVWDQEGLWRGVPNRVHSFIRGFTGKEGYTGNVYSTKYIMTFLAGKEVNFLNVAEMKTKLGIEVEPSWWDRNSWAAYIEKAMAKVEA